MLENLKKRVYEENLKLVRYNLVKLTWGNVSGIDREKGLIVIKPSGVDYSTLKADDMVVVDLEGNVVEGFYKPSSDTKTHIELYKSFPEIGGVVHTHSTNAVAWSQSKRNVPVYGTTHADNFFGPIPCTRELSEDEISNDYEKNVGTVIVETFKNLNYLEIPAVNVANHGPFCWGNSPENAVENAVIFEMICDMALKTELLDNNVSQISQNMLVKHYFRKHGNNSYYGQKDHKK